MKVDRSKITAVLLAILPNKNAFFMGNLDPKIYWLSPSDHSKLRALQRGTSWPLSNDCSDLHTIKIVMYEFFTLPIETKTFWTLNTFLA